MHTIHSTFWKRGGEKSIWKDAQRINNVINVQFGTHMSLKTNVKLFLQFEQVKEINSIEFFPLIF